MSPEAIASAAELARLLKEITSDRTAIERRAREVEEIFSKWATAATDRAQLALIAVGLHAWYTGLEMLCERVARTIDRSVPNGPRSHSELLHQAMAEIPRARPALLPSSSRADLDALLDFRHFFRHAYSVDLDPARLQENATRLLRAAPAVNLSLDELCRFLGETIDELTRT